jgi:hypothetical protein
MILSEPSIIFIWTYQGMMEWMSRMLIGEMAGDHEDFQANEADCCSQPYPPSPTKHDPHGLQVILSEPSIIFIWTYQDMMEWMNRILMIGEMAGDDEDFEANEADCCSQPYPPSPSQHMIHMDQMILSEPSIIFIWTYQDMMQWMSRILVGEMADGDDEDFWLGK